MVRDRLKTVRTDGNTPDLGTSASEVGRDDLNDVMRNSACGPRVRAVENCETKIRKENSQ